MYFARGTLALPFHSRTNTLLYSSPGGRTDLGHLRIYPPTDTRPPRRWGHGLVHPDPAARPLPAWDVQIRGPHPVSEHPPPPTTAALPPALWDLAAADIFIVCEHACRSSDARGFRPAAWRSGPGAGGRTWRCPRQQCRPAPLRHASQHTYPTKRCRLTLSLAQCPPTLRKARW